MSALPADPEEQGEAPETSQQEGAEMPQAPPEVQSSDQLTPQALEAQMRWAIYQGSVGAAAATDPRDFEEWANGILRFAQSVVILDPQLVAPQGVPADALHPPLPKIPMDKTQGGVG